MLFQERGQLSTSVSKEPLQIQKCTRHQACSPGSGEHIVGYIILFLLATFFYVRSKDATTVDPKK